MFFYTKVFYIKGFWRQFDPDFRHRKPADEAGFCFSALFEDEGYPADAWAAETVGL